MERPGESCSSVSSGWTSSPDGEPSLAPPAPRPMPMPPVSPEEQLHRRMALLYAAGPAAQSRITGGPSTSGGTPSGTPLGAAPDVPPAPPSRPTSAVAVPDGHSGERRRRKKKKRVRVVVNLSRCKYDVLREVVADLGWEVDDDVENLGAFASLLPAANGQDREKPPATWTPAGNARQSTAGVEGAVDPVALLNSMVQAERCQIVWSDVSVLVQSVSKLKCWQRVNHFPAMNLICRKVLLAQQLARMEQRFPEVYTFFPRSYSVRGEGNQLSQYVRQTRNRKTWILKPNAGCQGAGIVLTKFPDKAIAALPTDDYVCQEYIARPLLIERKKFDMRVYVLVLGIANLKILVHEEGLVRMCTSDYVRPRNANMHKTTMHLTNYAINKKSDEFVFGSSGNAADGSTGFKRDFAFFRRFLEERFGGVEGYRRVWQSIERTIVLTVLSAYHQLRHAYCAANPTHAKSGDCRTCFELLGFDVLLDAKGNPYILEVNHSPSFACDSAIDHRIKYKLLHDTLSHVAPYMCDVRTASDLQYKKLVAKLPPDADVAVPGTGFRSIYPPDAEPGGVPAARGGHSSSAAVGPAGPGPGPGPDPAEDDDDPVPEAADVLGRDELLELYDGIIAATVQTLPGATRRSTLPRRQSASASRPAPPKSETPQRGTPPEAAKPEPARPPVVRSAPRRSVTTVPPPVVVKPRAVPPKAVQAVPLQSVSLGLDSPHTAAAGTPAVATRRGRAR